MKGILESLVDFERLHRHRSTRLFVSATHARTGKVRIFSDKEITSRAILASGCLPYLFAAVDIDGEPYWDGGYSSNPSLWPFIQDKATRDILLVRLFPATRPDIPRQPAKILNRINEVTLDNALMQELRAIDFINRLVAEKDYFGHDYEAFRLHRIDPDPSVLDQPDVRWVDDSWTNFCKLRDAGRAAADAWLGENYEDIGARGTFDVSAEFAPAR